MNNHTACEDTLSLVQQQRNQAIGRVNVLADENDDLRARAEKAERERDEARGALRARLGVLAEPRPLTPDAITDEMVRRARSAWLEFARTDGIPTPEVTREMLAAALTEPPARPEGAEEIQRLLTEDLGHLAPPVTPEAVADLLAYRGVRVVAKEY